MHNLVDRNADEAVDHSRDLTGKCRPTGAFHNFRTASHSSVQADIQRNSMSIKPTSIAALRKRRYSSMTCLKKLPVAQLKIDQSFVREMLSDRNDLAIVTSMVGLARTFGIDVIAEGVETLEEGVALLKVGCELDQGYAIAHPMPAAELPLWVKDWKPDAAWATVKQQPR
jgi:hypothetical protein